MRRLTILLAAVFLLAGCSTLERNQPSLSQTARIWINQTAALDVLEAGALEEELYVRFNVFSKDSEEYKIFTAYASWDEKKDPQIDLSRDIVVTLRVIGDEEWAARPQQLKKVVSLPEKDWRQFRYDLAHRIVPQESLRGVLIRAHEEELVLYYDAEDRLQIIDIKKKPADVTVKETLSQRELTEHIVGAMGRFLDGKGIENQRVLLTVDNEDDYTTPFFYVDREKGVALNLRLPVGDEDKYRQTLLKKGLKSADYLLFDSYVLGLVKRPVSSSLRLFSWARSISGDALRPPSLAVFENTPPGPLYKGEPMDMQAFQKKLDQHIGREASHGKMHFLVDGDQFFPSLIDAIIGAKESIDVRIFIFDNDDYAVAIADLLKRRSKEGVKVRVLLDGMGQVMGETKVPETLPPGYKPPGSMEKYLRGDSNIEVRVRPNAWFKADHTKTIIVDNEMFYAGGMNIGREYRYHWHDLMMAVEGPVVDDIRREFEIAWAHAGPWGDLGYLKTILEGTSFSDKKDAYPVRPLYTRLNDPQIYKAQLLAIREAKKYIYIHNPYFSDGTIIYELIRARRRGVDVRVIMPFSGNHNIMNDSNVVAANTLFKNGIRVFFYPRMSHVKAAVYDGWLCTGSANFDKLSLVDNLELNLATAHEETVNDILTRLFEKDFEESMEMKELLDAGWKERLAAFIAEHL